MSVEQLTDLCFIENQKLWRLFLFYHKLYLRRTAALTPKLKSAGEAKMTIKAVVFDLDGTIVKFNLDYKAARAEVIEYLAVKGFPRSLFSLGESAFDMLKKAEITMKNNGKKQTEFLNLKEEVFRILEK